MSNECRCCGGRCGGPAAVEWSRRDFLGNLAAGTAAMALSGQLLWAEGAGVKPLSLPAKTSGWPSYPLTPPRVYRGKNLEAVGMPLGGIGTGSIWLNGQGQLGVWQIFNNLGEPRIPNSFFAVRARSGKGQAVTRVLQTQAEGGLQPVESLDYEGGYPIARLAFHDASLPVEVLLEATNPMIPLDAANSSIPCVIFRLTAKNPGATAAEVALFATLQNAVGSINGYEGFGGYGGNRNRVVRLGHQDGLVAVAMDRLTDPVLPGPVKVRTARGMVVPSPDMLWLGELAKLNAETAKPLAQMAAAAGGVALVDGVTPDVFKALAELRSQPGYAGKATVFEDFREKTYEGWTSSGTAFGKSPSHGTEPGPQPATGPANQGPINVFQDGEGAQGTLTSKPFLIQRPYIGFLYGGGKHLGETTINLRVGGKIVRTASPKDRQTLAPGGWDVAEFKGQQATIEIVDRSSGSWDHIAVDRIIFADVPPVPLLEKNNNPDGVIAGALGVTFTAAEAATLPADSIVAIDRVSLTELTTNQTKVVQSETGEWTITRYTRLAGFRDGDHGYRVLVSTPAGDPLLIEGPLGRGRILLALAPGMPWSLGSKLLAAARGEPLKSGEQLVPGGPASGTMTLAALDAPAVAMPVWKDAKELAAFIADPAAAKPTAAEVISRPGETIKAALAVPFTLQPGESRTVTFAMTWHFPNTDRFGHAGNLYNRRWPDATAVAGYLAANLPALWERTWLYHATLYQSNLPEEFLDAMTSQSMILRGPTCFWSEDGYFAGFEGSYGCCPLNCTHVWNYAQAHARLFPEVGRNMRISNFVTFLHPTGETSHREHALHGAFIDGHCACIEAAYREYQLSPDRRFLEQIWPGVKKSVDWLIQRIDPAKKGVPHGNQDNTYDSAVVGANTFIGSQYLSALAAAERMARVMNDPESADRWHAILAAGMKDQDAKLWNGEYYIQLPERWSAHDYYTGCHADQLLGQWWAHMLNLGYLYPADRVRSALAAIMKYNFREKFAGFKQSPRRYILDDDGGLIICTWPHDGRPKPWIQYADEVWTGIEYAVAGAMLYEGLVEDARKIVRMARSRYDGRRRNGLDSGPGGNPYNELECGKFYARAMSSWSLLTACQGQVLDGPLGILGFQPNWQPEDHRSFFTAPEGWGLFIQQRKGKEQTERIEVRHGRLRLRELVFALPKSTPATATVTISGQPAAATLRQAGTELQLVLEQESVVPEGSAVEVAVWWNE